MNLSFALFAVAAFVAVVLCLEGLYNLWASRHGPQARRIAARLEALAGDPVARASIQRVEQAQRLPRLNALLERTTPGRALQRWVATSALKVSAAELMVLSLLLGAVGQSLPVLLGEAPALGAAVALGLAVLPWWRVAHGRQQRIQRIERQFPQALDLSVISSISRCGAMSDWPISAAKSAAKRGSPSSSGVMFNDRVSTSGQVPASSSARAATWRDSGATSAARSATANRSRAPIGPSVGCRQRASASAPVTAPVTQENCG